VSELILAGMPHTEQNNQLNGVYKRSRQRILTILDDALLLTEIDVNAERFKSASVSLIAALSRALDKTAEFAKSRRVSLILPALDVGLVAGDEELLIRALNALVETAIKFSTDGGTIELSSGTAPDLHTVVIVSHGRAIPDSVLPKFFDLLAIGEAITPGGDLGLAPALAFRILSLFGGSVSVANTDPPGIRLTISLQSANAHGHLAFAS
jgi:two-component system sensor histidine kinase ChvG